MKTFAVLIVLALAASPALAQTSRARVDQALVIGGLSMSSIALGVTMACVHGARCREGNPLLAPWLDGDSPVRGPVVKSVATGAVYYAAWRLTTGKTRTILLASLTAICAVDAAHDIRQMGKVQGR